MASPPSKKKSLDKMATSIGRQPYLDDFDAASFGSLDDGVSGVA